MLRGTPPSLYWKFLDVLVFLALLALFLSLSLHQIVNFDIWWHLRTGRYIMENLSVPRSDIYTYTYPSAPWIDLHWGFQVAAYAIFSLLGPDGLIALQSFALGMAFILVARASPSPPPLSVSAPFVMCALFVSDERFIVRPEIFTLLFAALYLYGLGGRRRRLIALFPLVQIAWVNTGGLFVVGPGILYLHLAGEIAQKILSRRERRSGWDHVRFVSIIAVLATAVCLVNPFGLRGLAFPLTLFSKIGGERNLYSMTIAEFQRPLVWPPSSATAPLLNILPALRSFFFAEVTHSVFFFKVLLAISLFSLAVNIRKVRLSSLLTYCAFLYLALSARRNMALFSLVAVAVSLENLSSFWAVIRAKKRIRATLRLAACALVLITVWRQVPAIVSGRYYMQDNTTKRFGRGFSHMMYPLEAAEFVARAPVGGGIFNDLSTGGLLDWKLFPGRKTFIDGRLEVMPEEFYREYLEIISRPEEKFEPCASKYGIQLVVLNHRAVGRRLLTYLHESPLWQPVHFDEIGVVFCRAGSQNASFIRDHAVDFWAPFEEESSRDGFPYARFYRGNFLMTIGLAEPARREYEEGLRLFPGYAPGYNALGEIFEEEGKTDKARSLYLRALEVDPRLFEAHLNLGNLELGCGFPALALSHYRRAVALDPSSLDARVNMGTARARLGDLEGAIEEYRRALSIDPSSEAASRNLRIVMERARSLPPGNR